MGEVPYLNDDALKAVPCENFVVVLDWVVQN